MHVRVERALRVMVRVGMLGCVVVGCWGCATAPPPALEAIKREQITLGTPEVDVQRIAGEPELVLARSQVETFFYNRGDGKAVSISLVAGAVAAFNDSDTWPRGAFEAMSESDHPVSNGKVRLGMAEAEVRTLLGPPNGLTADDGVEQFHWLTSDDVDSVVALKDGVVTGFWDHRTTELSQNLPTEGSDRDEATTGGAIRVGMTPEQVQAKLGEPDRRAGSEGVITHTYESDAIFGDDILYRVGYRDGKVVALSEFNEDREEEREEAKAKAEAEAAAEAAAEAQREQTDSVIFSILGNPFVQQALFQAVTGNKGAPTKTIRKTTTQSSSKRTLTINGKTYTGGEHLGKRCDLNAPCPSGYTCHLITSKSGLCVQ